MYTSLILCTSALVVAIILLTFAKKSDGTFNKFLKIFTVVFCAVGFFRFMLSDSFVYVINGAYFNGVYYDATDVLQTILRWGYYLNYAVLPMAVFFEGRLFKNIASYFCLPFTLLSTIFFNDFMGYFLSSAGQGLHLVPWIRYVYFVVELILALVIPIVMQIRHKHVFNVKDKKEWKNFLIALPFVVIIMMPVYVPQSLIGYSSLLAKIGSAYHIAWIALLLIVTLGLYYIFRFKNKKERYMLCVFLTIVLFFHYDSLYLMGFSIPRLPIQLCNIASYFYMVAILFKKNKLFQFCFIANITGALIAIVAADFSVGAFGFWNMHFVFEHSLVLMIPALAMGLRIFPRISKSTIKYTFIGFCCYFVFCLTAGTLLNAFSNSTGYTVNYFYLFDLKKALKYFAFLTFVRDFGINIGDFTLYPFIVLIVFVAFFLLCLIFYALVKLLYKIEDDHIELRKSAIELYEKHTGKKSKLPKDFSD